MIYFQLYAKLKPNYKLKLILFIINLIKQIKSKNNE